MADEHHRFKNLFISPQTFRKRLEFLNRHYKIIRLEEAVRQLTTGRVEPYQAVLTFDDGYYNFLSVAAPILEEYQIPATVYVVSYYLEKQKPFHSLLIRDIILRSELDVLSENIPGIPAPVPLRSAKDKERLVRLALKQLFEYPFDSPKRDEFAGVLAEKLQVDIDTILKKRYWHSITGEEAKQLSQKGYSIELHGHSHHNVVEHPKILREEVKNCKDIVDKATQKDARFFCYPSGLWKKEAWKVLNELGIQCAVTTRNGPNFSATPLFALRRYLDGEYQHQLEFEFLMSNLRWLLHSVFHPARFTTPSEKVKRYKEDGKIF